MARRWAWGLAAAALAAPAAARADGCPDLAGAWRGASTCIDRTFAPACADEQLRFAFARQDGGLRVHAEKQVGSGFVSMGDLDLACDAVQRRWTVRIGRAGGEAVWSYGLAGAELAGDLKAGATVVRRVTARRAAAGGG